MGNVFVENLNVIQILIETVPAIAIILWIIDKQDKRQEKMTEELARITDALHQLTIQLKVMDAKLKEDNG